MAPYKNKVLKLTGTHDQSAHELFCRDLALKLAVNIRPSFKKIFEGDLKLRFLKTNFREPSIQEISKLMRTNKEVKLWYRMRTDNQDRIYDISASIIDQNRQVLEDSIRNMSGRCGSLILNPMLKLPNYMEKTNNHRTPGGYTFEKFENDVSQAALYDRTISIHNMGSQGPHNDDPGKSIAKWIKENYNLSSYQKILDMGCTIGNNTLPFKGVFPEASVWGVDISRPCLKYAHARACGLGHSINFLQANAEETPFQGNSFDLVFSRILLHETSKKGLRKIILECYRLLKPGGLMIHCDAPQFDSITPYEASLRDWDATCNNEPFMTALYSMSLEKLYLECGFKSEDFIQQNLPSIFAKHNHINGDATPGFRKSYFITGAIKPL
jgi:ubiquinone/menaquinone biosynthesis C-methylase UbiE